MGAQTGTKPSLRTFFRKACSSIPFKEQNQAQNQINRQLEAFLSTTGGLWGAYRSFPQEASLDHLLKQPNRPLCFPRLEAHTMAFHQAKEESDFEQHPWGFSQPKASCPQANLSSIQGFFVPLLAFDAQGVRLGQGKGYYDRYLKNYSGPIVALAFTWQFSKTPLPKEKHDKKLTCAITDKKIWHFTCP